MTRIKQTFFPARKALSASLVLGFSLLAAGTAQAALIYDADVTSNAIWGSGNANGGFTVDRSNNVELGLRGKLRHNASGLPEDTFNSNGDGTYSFAAGVAPTQLFPTAVWSFEWSINVDLSGTSGRNLDDLTYVLGLDSDASAGMSFTTFDLINALNPNPFIDHWDHSIGDNTTATGAGTEATDLPSYQNLLANNNLAQNSWKAHWYLPAGFDPTVDGTYNFFLSAFDSAGAQLARTDIQIIVGEGGEAAVPEPETLLLYGVALAGLGLFRRKA